MDVVLVMLLFVYIAQGVLLFINHFLGDTKKLIWLTAACFTALILFMTSKTLFALLLLFYLVFFSRTSRPSDYGFTYHFTIISAVGFVYGPFAGLLFGLVPLLLVPKVRPDVQVVDIIANVVLLSVVGIASGIVGYLTTSFVVPAIIMLLLYNLILMVALYGKLPMARVTLPFFVNISLNYYLVTFYLVKLMGIMGYAAPK